MEYLLIVNDQIDIMEAECVQFVFISAAEPT